MNSGCHLYSLWILLWLGIQSQVNTFAKEERFQVTSVAPEIRSTYNWMISIKKE
jgi:hypothetical protein